MARPNPVEGAQEMQRLLVDYAKQETVEPLKTLGRYLGLGIAGALVMFVDVDLALPGHDRRSRPRHRPHLPLPVTSQKKGPVMTETAGITPADIEAKFRDIQGQMDVVAENSKKKAAIAGSVLAIIILLLVYVFGRNAGKKTSSVLEIRRL